MPRLRRSCRKELQRNYVYRYGQTIGRLQRQLFCLFALLQVISLALNMTRFLSPIGTSCHFAYAADAPLLSLSRHFPRFSGGIYPEGGSENLL